MPLEQLTANVYYLPHDNAHARPALGYVAGQSCALMVDAGNAWDHAALYLCAVDAAGLARPGHVVLTHWHWDHSYGLHAVPATRYASALTNAQLHKMSGWSWSHEAMRQRLKDREDVIYTHMSLKKTYPDRSLIRVVPADVTFEDDYQLDLGGQPVRFLRIENNHSSDGVVVLVPQEGVLFLGDTYSLDFYSPRPCFHPDKLQKYLAALAALPFDLAVPGHAPVLTKAQLLAYVEEKIRHPEVRMTL